MVELPDVPRIDGDTKLVGILADPIHHVQTPQLINRLFVQTSVNAVVVPLHVGASDLTGVVDSVMRIRNMAGLIITVPHKVAAASLCDELRAAGRMIGAVNAIRFESGRRIGDNFDGQGFVQGLGNDGVTIGRASRVYLAGAGGTARAIAFAVLATGAGQLTIYNRSADKARALIDEVAVHFPGIPLALGTNSPVGHDLVINATSAGLSPEDPLPLDAAGLTSSMTVAEVIMAPRDTPLLLAARGAGCRIVYGKNMLEAQIALLAAHTLGMPDLCSRQPRG